MWTFHPSKRARGPIGRKKAVRDETGIDDERHGTNGGFIRNVNLARPAPMAPQQRTDKMRAMAQALMQQDPIMAIQGPPGARAQRVTRVRAAGEFCRYGRTGFGIG